MLLPLLPKRKHGLRSESTASAATVDVESPTVEAALARRMLNGELPRLSQTPSGSVRLETDGAVDGHELDRLASSSGLRKLPEDQPDDDTSDAPGAGLMSLLPNV